MECRKETFSTTSIIFHSRALDVVTVIGITIVPPNPCKTINKQNFSVCYNLLLFFHFRLSHFRRSSSAALASLYWKCLLRVDTLTWSSASTRSDVVLARTAASFRNFVHIPVRRIDDPL